MGQESRGLDQYQGRNGGYDPNHRRRDREHHQRGNRESNAAETRNQIGASRVWRPINRTTREEGGILTEEQKTNRERRRNDRISNSPRGITRETEERERRRENFEHGRGETRNREWLERTPQGALRSNERQRREEEGRETVNQEVESQCRGRPIERELSYGGVPTTNKFLTMKEVMEDLRASTLRYINHPDIQERTTRRLRCSSEEDQVLMENTTRRIIEVATGLNATNNLELGSREEVIGDLGGLMQNNEADQ